ncbi:MAG: cytidylate kinase [Candidatus Bathyarchaeota archaeon BA2]|nr:MAG: cytidylate kinase [Candidatus Bathyarchaeota archaeon BA2]
MKIGCGKSSKKIVICICGMTGCGKSTVAKRLAEKYGLRYLSGGNTLKVLAIEAGYKPAEIGWWETDEGIRFLQRRMEDSEFDKKVDGKLLELAKWGNVVLDSWTMPWLLKEGFKVWLEASSGVRTKRLAVRDGISVEMASEVLGMKDESTRAIYKSLYGFDLGNDFSPFDLILDTNELNADEVFNAVCLVVDRLIFGKF